MKRNLLLSFLVLTLMLAPVFAQKNKPKAVSLPKVAPKVATTVKQAAEVPFVNKVLANGLEVIVLPDSSVPIVTVEIAARNGSFTEPPELNGLSHLFEHMFFKRNRASMVFLCEKLQARKNSTAFAANNCEENLKLKEQVGNLDYLNNIDELGINYNGSTREEVVNYYFTTTSPYWTTAMQFVKDSVRYPTFDEEDFVKEKEVVIGEIDRNQSQPFYYLSQAMIEKLFFKYPSRKNALGNRETVSTATTTKMRLIQSRYYVPNNCALVVTGDVEPEKVFAEAEKLFGDWKRRTPDPFTEFPLVEHPPLPKSEGTVIEQPVNNVFIQVGWHGPSIGKDDAATYAADVFSFILRQPNSRFSRNLTDSGLVAALDLTYYTQRNVGPITLTMVTTPEKSRSALKTVYQEIAQFDSPNYFTDEELESAKALLAAEDLYSREKLSDYTHTLSFWWSSTGIDYFRGYQKNLRAITRADINRYVQTYIKNKPHISLALMSADANAKSKLTEDELIGK